MQGTGGLLSSERQLGLMQMILLSIDLCGGLGKYYNQYLILGQHHTYLYYHSSPLIQLTVFDFRWVMENSFQISTEEGSLQKSIVIDSACHLNMTYDDKTSVSISHQYMLQKSFKKNVKKTKEVIRKKHEFTNENFFNPNEGMKGEEECGSSSVYKHEDYPVLNLTRTLYNYFPSVTILKLICFAGAAVRVYLTFYFFSVLGVTTGLKMSKWYFLGPWIMAVIGSRLLYLILVVKVGLTSPQNQIQRTLKNIWNRQTIRVNQAFQYITPSIFFKCLLKGLIPVQFSFLYIPSTNHRRSLIYSTINFIYMSIESVLMFPFVAIYTLYILLTQIQGTQSFWKYTWVTLISTGLWISLFTTLCGYLIWRGYKLKQERIW